MSSLVAKNAPKHIKDIIKDIESKTKSDEINRLCYEQGKLVLKYNQKELYFDFQKLHEKFLNQKINLKKQPFAQSLGLPKNKNTLVLDATCGSGTDSILMLTWGLKVISFEKNPLIYALLKDAIHRSSQLQKNLEIKFGDSTTLTEKFPLIYYDPLFNLKKKSKSKKIMETIKEISHSDQLEEQEHFLSWALSHVEKKIIVKRHLRSDYLSGKKPHQSFVGHSVRYDVYLP